MSHTHIVYDMSLDKGHLLVKKNRIMLVSNDMWIDSRRKWSHSNEIDKLYSLNREKIERITQVTNYYREKWYNLYKAEKWSNYSWNDHFHKSFIRSGISLQYTFITPKIKLFSLINPFETHRIFCNLTSKMYLQKHLLFIRTLILCDRSPVPFLSSWCNWMLAQWVLIQLFS